MCKLVPDKIPDKKMNLPNAIAYVPELQAAEVSPDPILRDTIKYAKMLEGNVRNTGVHACGTIICISAYRQTRIGKYRLSVHHYIIHKLPDLQYRLHQYPTQFPYCA